MNKILEIENLVQYFNLDKNFLDKIKWREGKFVKEESVVRAVNDLSFTINEGEIFSLVGESGCGKSTVARTITKLIEPKNGKIKFKNDDITNIHGKEMLKYRQKMQMIFQDPYASLNPKQRVIDILVEPMIFHKIVNTQKEAKEKALELLEKVGLRPEQSLRYPHQFSGGQRQRIGIARALTVNPEFIIADEPVSALDVSIQAQILNLLMDLKDEFKFSYLFIAHDLSVVKHISDNLGIMYLGKIVEKGSKKDIFDNPLHPYSKLLFSAVPRLTGTNLKDSKNVEGEIPSAIDLPEGCYFHKRCPYVKDICKKEMPMEKEVEKDHLVMCHLY